MKLIKKQRSVVLKLGFITIGSFLTLFIIFNVFTNLNTYYDSKANGEKMLAMATENTALQMAEQFNHSIRLLQNESKTILSLIKQNQLSSDFLIDYKTKLLEDEALALGFSFILKEDYFQQMNSEHAQYVDNKGYFAPYIVKSDNSIVVEPVENATEGNWYTDVAANNELAITDPYEYEINGETVQMITISAPLILNNELIGVTVMDFSLDFLNPIVEANLPEDAVQRVATPNGILILDSNEDSNASKDYKDFIADWPNILSKLQANETVTFYADSVTFNEEAYNHFTPLSFDGYNKSFIIQTALPTDTILSTVYKQLNFAIGAAILISIILAALTYYFIHKSLKPLRFVQHALSTAATGQLTETVDEKALENNEIGAVGIAYNTMRNQVSEVIDHVVEKANELEHASNESNTAVEEISQSTNDMTDAIKEIATGAQAQANEIENANTEMTSLGINLDNLASMTNTMHSYVLQSNEQAEIGRSQIQQLHEQSALTNKGNAELEMQMNKLATQISQINAVMQSIQGITEQTNLLALNASIEAARAGEYGKGFAVVADEVKKLAEQSHAETEHVQKIVSNILTETEQTKNLATRNTTIFEEQLVAVTNTEQAFTTQIQAAEQIELQIEKLLQELSKMMKEKETILTNMQSVAAISEQSAASAEEMAATMDQQANEINKIVKMMNALNDISNELKEKASFFTTNDK